MADRRSTRPGGPRSRRQLLRTAVAGVAALSGCLERTVERAADRSGGTPTPTATPRERSTVTVTVGPDDRFGFYPGTDSSLRIATGTTVTFVWRTNAHNVVVDRRPDGATWEGTPGGAGATYEAGYTHQHTFTVPGRYRFHCAPHESIGAVGTIDVVTVQTDIEQV